MDSSGRLEELKLLWETDPTAKVYLQLADEYRRLGQLAEAVQVLEKTLAQRPRDPRGRVALARCRMDMGDLGEAVRLLEEVIKLDAAHPVASKLLLECHLQMRDADKAAERFNIYRLLNDRDPELDHLEFRLRRLQDHPEEAEQPVAAAAAPEPSRAPEPFSEPFPASAAEPVHVPAPATAEPQPFAAPAVFDSSLLGTPEPAAARQNEPLAPLRPAADPFGELPPPAARPSVDLFAFLSPSQPASPPPSFDRLWGAPVAPDSLVAVPAAEPFISPAISSSSGFSGDPFAGLLPAASATPTPADPFGDFFRAAPAPAAPAPAAPQAPAATAPAAPEEPMGATATLGDLYLQQGHFAEAEQIFHQVLEREPGNGAALAGLARLFELRQPAGPASSYQPETADEIAASPATELPPAYEPLPVYEPPVYQAPVYEPLPLTDEPPAAEQVPAYEPLATYEPAAAYEPLPTYEPPPVDEPSAIDEPLPSYASPPVGEPLPAYGAPVEAPQPDEAPAPAAEEWMPPALPVEPAYEPLASYQLPIAPFDHAEPSYELSPPEPALADPVPAAPAPSYFELPLLAPTDFAPPVAASVPEAAELATAADLVPQSVEVAPVQVAPAERPRLDAAFLLAQRNFGDAPPAGLTAKKILILRRYLEHLRPTRAPHVQ